jgi:hypothetical protein
MKTLSAPQFVPPPHTVLSITPSTWRLSDVLISKSGPLTVSSVVETACTDGLNG